MERKTVDELSKELEQWFNSMTVESTELAKDISSKWHRTIQQEFMGFLCSILVEFANASRQDRFDGRNAATVKLAEDLVAVLEEKGLVWKGKVKLPYI